MTKLSPSEKATADKIRQSMNKKPSAEHIRKIASSVEIIANRLPAKNLDYNTKIKIATDLVKACFSNTKGLQAKSALVRNNFLRIGTEIANAQALEKTYPEEPSDVISKSNTQAPQVTSTSKQITLPDPSKYKTYLECTQDLDTNYNLDPKVSAEFCKQVNPDTSGPKSAAYHDKHLENEMTAYKLEHKPTPSSPSIAWMKVNPYHPEWREQVEDAALSDLMERRLHQARLDLGLSTTEPAIPICVQRDSVIQQFREKGIVPEHRKQVKSAATKNKMSFDTIRRRDEIIQNQYLERQHQRNGLRQASASEVPSWLRVMNHTRQSVMGLGNNVE
jgi:hypothetical protein